MQYTNPFAKINGRLPPLSGFAPEPVAPGRRLSARGGGVGHSPTLSASWRRRALNFRLSPPWSGYSR